MQIQNLKIQNLGVKIAKKEILKNINFELKNGEILCILGKNGCGKSTLLKALLGLLDFSGEAILDSENAKCQNLKNFKDLSKIFSYVPQIEKSNLNFSLLEVVLMGRFTHSKFGNLNYTQDDVKLARNLLEMLEIAHLEKEDFNILSGGQRQLGLIARALAQNAPIVVLDEPVSALDLSHSFGLLRIIKRLKNDGKKSVIMTSHHPEQCFIADKILMIKDGENLFFGKRDAALNSENINELYGIDSEMVSLPNGGKYFFMDTQ